MLEVSAILFCQEVDLEMRLQCHRLILPDGTSNGVLAKIGISDGEMVKVIPHKATGASLWAELESPLEDCIDLDDFWCKEG